MPAIVTVKPDGLDHTAASDYGLSCVMDAIAASNLADHDIHFGFVGNEMAEDPATAAH